MNQPDAASRAKSASREHFTAQGKHVLQQGSRVCVTSRGPFWGLRGTIQTVDAIPTDVGEPFCFYLVALEGAQIKDPVWFAYDEVEEVGPARESGLKDTTFHERW